MDDLEIHHHKSYQYQLQESVKIIISEIRAKDSVLTDMHSLQLGQSSASMNLGVMVEEVLRAQKFLTPEFQTRAAEERQKTAALISAVQKGEKKGKSGTRGHMRIGSPIKDVAAPSFMPVQDPNYIASLAAKRKDLEEAQAAKRQRTDQSSSSDLIGRPTDEIYQAWLEISTSWPPTPRVANEHYLPPIPDNCLDLPTN